MSCWLKPTAPRTLATTITCLPIRSSERYDCRIPAKMVRYSLPISTRKRSSLSAPSTASACSTVATRKSTLANSS